MDVKISLHFMQKSLVYTWQICELADQNFSNGVLVISTIFIGNKRFFALPFFILICSKFPIDFI